MRVLASPYASPLALLLLLLCHGACEVSGTPSFASTKSTTSFIVSSPLTATKVSTLRDVNAPADLHDDDKVLQHTHLRGGETVLDGTTDRTLADTVKIGVYFALWYAFNIIYNIQNKKLLNILPAPLIVGTIQLGIGAIYAILLWVTRIRGIPILLPDGFNAVKEVGLYHGAGQLLSMVSLGAGPVSFTHIVKALEPFFSAIVSALVAGRWMPWFVYLTLIPVVGGVSFACLNERSFSWLAFNMAMGSNIVFALRAVISKQAMSNPLVGINITPPNMFALVTMASFVLFTPIALLGEGRQIIGLWKKALTKTTQLELIRDILLTGFFHYTGNEVMYLALGNVHPVTLAVGNTMKRVFVILASVIVFRNKMTPQVAVGSAIGLVGVLFYSLAKNHYEQTEADRKAQQAAKHIQRSVPPLVPKHMSKPPKIVAWKGRLEDDWFPRCR